MKKYFIFFFLILIACSQINTSEINYVEINNQNIPVQLAITTEQKTQGLMFVTNLTGGMLFVYDNEAQRSFWMKNTLIPLDMIFIDKNNKITTIHYALPCKADPCKIYASPNAKYVLEVNGNFTVKNNIKVGDKVSFLK